MYVSLIVIANQTAGKDAIAQLERRVKLIDFVLVVAFDLECLYALTIYVPSLVGLSNAQRHPVVRKLKLLRKKNIVVEDQDENVAKGMDVAIGQGKG